MKVIYLAVKAVEMKQITIFEPAITYVFVNCPLPELITQIEF